MKNFRVAVKDAAEDFILTDHVWLTVGQAASGRVSYKKDTKSELLLALAPDRTAGNYSFSGATGRLGFELLSQQLPDHSVFWVNTYDHTLYYHIPGSQRLYLYQRSEGRWMEFSGDGDRVSFMPGDLLVLLSGKLIQDQLESMLQAVNNPHVLNYELERQLVEFGRLGANGGPLLLTLDASEHQAFSFPIKSSLRSVSYTIEMIKNKVLKHHSEKIWQIETVLHEALVNAITYGNELDEAKTVHVAYEIGDKGLRTFIRDQGEGFDIYHVSVPVGEEALDRISGRGIYIMQKFSEDLFYGPKGNELVLFFKF